MGTITTWKATDDQHHADTRRRLASTSVATAALLSTLVACSSSKHTAASPSSSAARHADRCGVDVRVDGAERGGKLRPRRRRRGGTYTISDPYPQYTAGSPWVNLLNSCGASAGVKIKRTGYDTTALVSQTLLQAQQGTAPDVLILDNPVVSTLASAGVLADNSQTKLDTSEILPNLLAAGQLDNKTYGIPIGANTLALYYNKNVLTAAGVDATQVKDWASLNAALAKIKTAGKKGITISAIGTEEGSFQFLPWFWGVWCEPDQARLTASRCGLLAVGGLAEERLRAERSDPGHPDDGLAGIRHRRLWVRGERHLAARQRRQGRLPVRHHPDPGDERRAGSGADRW